MDQEAEARSVMEARHALFETAPGVTAAEDKTGIPVRRQSTLSVTSSIPTSASEMCAKLTRYLPLE